MVFTGIQLSALIILFALLFAGKSSASVFLIGNTFVSFRDIEAAFSPAVESPGIRGNLQVAQPLDACSPLINKAKQGEGRSLSFALIKKGNCTYESKVRNAQAAGFSAAIVYNNKYNSRFYKMSGNSEGITTHAVFISRAAGEWLQKYINKYENLECQITPCRNSKSLGWKMSLFSFIGVCVLVMFVVIYDVNRRQVRRKIMSCKELNALPTLTFTSPADDKGTSATCAVCLEDYTTGEKLRLLPCHHRFHAICIDFWLTKCRNFCPVCKRDVKNSCIKEPPASEQTPLLSSSPLMRSISISSSRAASTYLPTSGSWVVHIPSTFQPSECVSSYNGGSGPASIHLTTSGSWGVNIPSSTSQLPSPFVSSSNSGSPYLSQSFGSPRQ